MQLTRTFECTVGALLLLAACGDDEPVDPGPCWPLPSKPGGQVELGIGDIDFKPMPDVTMIVRNASQSDPYLEVHSRVHGIPPGDPFNSLDPHNPKTKVAVVIEAAGLSLGNECPASLGYVPASETDAFDLIHSLRIGFGAFPVDQVAGKQARITIEVVGSNKIYASDEKLVTLMLP